MLQTVTTVAFMELKLLFQEKTFLLLLGVFLLMAMFSSFIGYSTVHTVQGVYKETISVLSKSGSTNLPANPFLNIPVLSLFKNMIIYIFLIGSLLSVVLGNRAFVRERKLGVTKLLFSKPLYWRDFILGKIAGIALSLLIITAVTFLLTLISSFFITTIHLSQIEIFKLLTFYVVSYMYMLIFVFLGLLFAVFIKSESLSLLIPMVIWVGIHFILSELTSSLTPTALLNPVNISTETLSGGFFTFTHQFVYPLSLGEQYKTLTSQLLEVDPASSQFTILNIFSHNISILITLTTFLILSICGCFFSMKKYRVVDDVIYE